MGEIIKKDLSAVAGLLQKVLGKSDYSDIRRLGGLTNHTYHVIFANGEEYVVRIPGEGTEEIIVRDDEKKSTQLACKLGVDAPMLYFGENGAKVSQYLKNAQTMSAETIKSATHIAQIAQIFRTMHDCGEDTGVPFEVFDMAAGYEKIIDNMNVPMFADYDRYKAKLMQIKEEIDSTLEIKIVPCHNDPLCENWVLMQVSFSCGITCACFQASFSKMRTSPWKGSVRVYHAMSSNPKLTWRRQAYAALKLDESFMR